MGPLDLVISVVLEERKQQAGPAFCKQEQVLYDGSLPWTPEEKKYCLEILFQTVACDTTIFLLCLCFSRSERKIRSHLLCIKY